MRCRFLVSMFFFFLLVVAAFPAVADVPDPVAFETSGLIIIGRDGIDGGGREHSFIVELALSERQRARGLMFREKLADDAGMLFLHEGEAARAMWMKNTAVPLDILFFRKGGVIIRIEHGATPYSQRPISSGGPARGALELAGGTARRLGIVAGDLILHPLLEAAAK